MLSRRRILGTLAACMALAVCVAARAAAPVPAVRPMYFEHLTMRDGLSQSTVNSILQDSQGYLWLATESGLDRYDGNSIREYRRERGNEHALASDYIWAIAQGRTARRGSVVDEVACRGLVAAQAAVRTDPYAALMVRVQGENPIGSQ